MLTEQHITLIVNWVAYYTDMFCGLYHLYSFFVKKKFELENLEIYKTKKSPWLKKDSGHDIFIIVFCLKKYFSFVYFLWISKF